MKQSARRTWMLCPYGSHALKHVRPFGNVKIKIQPYLMLYFFKSICIALPGESTINGVMLRVFHCSFQSQESPSLHLDCRQGDWWNFISLSRSNPRAHTSAVPSLMSAKHSCQVWKKFMQLCYVPHILQISWKLIHSFCNAANRNLVSKGLKFNIPKMWWQR